MQPTLTRRQLEVLRFFRDYRAEHGLSPTLEEAALHLEVSKITIYEHLNQLVKKGAVRRDKAKARAVTVLFDPDAEAPDYGGTEQVGWDGPPSLQVLGRIAAGRPIEAVEHPEQFSMDELLPRGESYYLLAVRGKSMIEDHIDDGDLVLVERRETARNGEVVVAILDDEEATFKRFYRESDGRIRLQPANSELEPIYPDHIEIRGVVRGVVRRYR